MDRTSSVIVASLEALGATNELCCANLEEIVQGVDIGRSKRTVSRKLAELILEGYVASGPTDGNAKTYYITVNGTNFLRNGGKDIEK